MKPLLSSLALKLWAEFTRSSESRALQKGRMSSKSSFKNSPNSTINWSLPPSQQKRVWPFKRMTLKQVWLLFMNWDRNIACSLSSHELWNPSKNDWCFISLKSFNVFLIKLTQISPVSVSKSCKCGSHLPINRIPILLKTIKY